VPRGPPARPPARPPATWLWCSPPGDPLVVSTQPLAFPLIWKGAGPYGRDPGTTALPEGADAGLGDQTFDAGSVRDSSLQCLIL
jgi:hypothetical protein